MNWPLSWPIRKWFGVDGASSSWLADWYVRGLEFNNTSAPVDFVTNSSSFKPVFHSSSNRGRNANSLLFFGSSFVKGLNTSQKGFLLGNCNEANFCVLDLTCFQFSTFFFTDCNFLRSDKPKRKLLWAFSNWRNVWGLGTWFMIKHLDRWQPLLAPHFVDSPSL